MDDVTETGPIAFGNGRFALKRALGTTSVGGVFEAVDRTSKRSCAVKLHDRSATSDQASERFLAEARVLAEVDHPHVLHAWDHGCEHGFCWYAMDLLPRSLRDHAKAKGRLPPDVAVAAAMQVLAALHEIHGRSMIHRDVKLTNVLVGDDSRLRLADFGVAHHPDGTVPFRTVPGQGLGTPGYGAPEQWESDTPLGPPTDLFAVGVLLYRMLTGGPPERLHLAHYREGLLSGLPPSLQSVLLTATRVPVDERFADALEMAEALARAAAELPAPIDADRWADALSDRVALDTVDWGRATRWFAA